MVRTVKIFKKSKKRNIANANGFTLIELMISVIIFTVMIAMVMLLITTANTAYHTAEARIVSQQDLRRAVLTMLHELSESNEFRVAFPAANEVVFQIPIRVLDVGPLQGELIDDDRNIIYGARPIPTVNPDGNMDYAIRYFLRTNNDISNSNQLVRQVLDAFPAGNVVGTERIIANAIQNLQFTQNGQTLVVDVSAVKNNKFGRNETIQGIFGITLRN